jgi:hypothetical protein
VAAIGLPPFRPVNVHFRPEDGVIEFRYDTAEHPQTQRVEGAALGAFLVSYCIRARIPLPRLADKEIRVEPNAIVLRFITHYQEAPAPDDGMGSVWSASGSLRKAKHSS